MPGLREGLIGLIALVALYMAFMLWRMRRLRRGKAEQARAASLSESSATPQAEAELPVMPALPETDEISVPTEEWSAPKEAPGMAMPGGLEQEVLLLREEVDILRGELAALREDMLQELAHLRATQTVSPIYGDAMQMAAAGYEPAMIAERCGIARAEAELVVALSKNRLAEGE